ncbi:hypothetical protein ACTXT7_000087 [Hymenolepis weldensis]
MADNSYTKRPRKSEPVRNAGRRFPRPRKIGGNQMSIQQVLVHPDVPSGKEDHQECQRHQGAIALQ